MRGKLVRREPSGDGAHRDVAGLGPWDSRRRRSRCPGRRSSRARPVRPAAETPRSRSAAVAPPRPAPAAAPDRSDRVDHVSRRQVVAAGDARLARRAAAERAALAEQARTGGAVDGAVHAAAAEQRAVGGVDDRVHVEARDVTLNHPHACAQRFAPGRSVLIAASFGSRIGRRPTRRRAGGQPPGRICRRSLRGGTYGAHIVIPAASERRCDMSMQMHPCPHCAAEFDSLKSLEHHLGAIARRDVAVRRSSAA